MQFQLVVNQKKTLVFTAQLVTLVDSEITDNVYGQGTGLHTFRTLDPAFLESVKQAMSNADPIMDFRLGFGSPTQMFWLPWQRHIIVSYLARFEGLANTAGHLIVFNTANNFVRMQRANKVTARKGTISDIVKAIAKDNKMEAVVEPTSENKFILYQTFTDDTRFIQERLLPRAINGKGRGGYHFFIRDNVLHFHTPDYQSTARQMNYYDVFGTELAIHDISQNPSLWDSGVAGARVIAHDPYTGQTQEIQSKPDNALRLAESIYQFSSISNGQRNVPYHLSFNPPSEVDAIAQHYYQIARQQVFKSEVTLNKTILIRHGDLLNLVVTQQTSQASSHGGYYYVVSAKHAVRKQSVTSLYTMIRGEIRGQDQSLSAQNTQQQLVADTKAPGQDPNILEVQSSEATKGAGNSSARPFTMMTDAATGKPVD